MTIEYMDKVHKYMEYLMGGEEACNTLTIGWAVEDVAHHMYCIAEAAYPHYRMAALGIVGAMLYATIKNRAIQ